MSESYIDAPRPPEQAHGDALAALQRMKLRLPVSDECAYQHAADEAIVRRHLTASGVPYVPEEVLRLPDEWRRSADAMERLGWEENRARAHQLREGADELESALASAPAVCEWHKPDPGTEIYETACGSDFEMPAGMLMEELPSMRYCSNCGRRIAAAPQCGGEHE